MTSNNFLPIAVLVSVVLIFGFLFWQSISEDNLENLGELTLIEEPNIQDEEISGESEEDIKGTDEERLSEEELLPEDFGIEENYESEIDDLNIFKEVTMNDFVDCLVEEGVIVYASRTCSACGHFANEFGGYEKVENLFVECTEERQRCSNEKKTGYVPEIQIEGELYDGNRSLYFLSEKTNCLMPTSS